MENLEIVREVLQNKINELNKTGWIKAIVRSDKDACLELERTLEKIGSNYHVVTKMTSKKTYKLLFVVNPSGPTSEDSSRLRQTYGKLILNGEAKSLRVPLFADKETLFDNKYYFKLVIDKKAKKIFIRITDINNNLLEQSVYWTFDSLKNMISKKQKKIVLIEYDTKYVQLDEFYKIKDLVIYEKINFNKFLKELSLGHIRVYLKVGAYTSGIYLGKTHDHGATFQITDAYLKDLYDIHILKNSL